MKRESELCKKLHSQSGETIGETLVALLISSLALVMLASMISATVNLVSKSQTKMDDYYIANTALENVNTGESMTIVIKGAEEPIQDQVLFTKNNTFSKPVVAYSVDQNVEENNTDGG